MWEGITSGLSTALVPENLLLVATGCITGTFIGMLPGLGPISAIALMIPMTYGFDPASGMILMAGVYYGAEYGGSIASILLNLPGTPVRSGSIEKVVTAGGRRGQKVRSAAIRRAARGGRGKRPRASE